MMICMQESERFLLQNEKDRVYQLEVFRKVVHLGNIISIG